MHHPHLLYSVWCKLIIEHARMPGASWRERPQLSAHHAWVVGALESATRGVYQFLFAHSGNSKAINEALDAYNAGDIEAPFGPLPTEFDRMKDVGEAGVDVDMKKAAAEGERARQGVIFERIRLEQGGDQLDLSKVTKKDVAPLLAAGHMHEI